MTAGRVALLLPACLIATACARDSVVLLPGEPGRPVGALAVINEDGSDRGVLSNAYSDANLSGGTGAVAARKARQTKIDARYGELVSYMPPPAYSTRVPFEFDTFLPGPGAQEALERVTKAIKDRPGAQVQVIGHTDSPGSLEYNDALSFKRAAAVRDYLVANGMPSDQIRVSGVGERQPVNDVGDEVPDADNREAEVVVR